MSTTVAPDPRQVDPVAPPVKGPFMVIDRGAFLPRFNTRACFVHHKLADHPYFSLPRLLALAKRLPPKYVRINSGAVPVNATPAQIPGTGLSLEESFDRIGDSNTRIMLKAIEKDPEYRHLLHACLGEIEALGHPCTRGIWIREGYVFLSAPNMTTPYHMDPEVNFLLQVRGRKAFHVLPGSDRSILSEQDIEGFYSGHHTSLPFKEDWKGRAEVFDMRPGDGVHIPVNHPHWVTTGDEVTISFALTFQSAETRRRGRIYSVNHLLRQRGWNPRPFGQSPLGDFIKHQCCRARLGLKACLPGKKREEKH